MSWYQSVAGAEVRLSPSVQKRLGVTGFGVDDVGVIRNPAMLASLVEVGQQVGAVDDDDIEAFVSLKHGSSAQIKAANRLGRKSLTALRSEIEENVSRRLAGVPGTKEKLYKKYCEWADSSGWELPVGCLEEQPYQCFSLSENGGLCVFECGANKVPGAIGDVLVTILGQLVVNALKMPAIAAIHYSMMMGLDCNTLSRRKGFEQMRHADDSVVLKWLEEVEPDMCGEMMYWNDDAEAMLSVACQLRDLAFADFDEQQRIERVVGGVNDDCRENRNAYMAHLRKAAENCESSVLRDFALTACDCLAGQTTSKMIEMLPADERLERLPGDLSVVDTGLSIDDIDYHYNNINENALNGEDLAFLPLEGSPELVVALLTRITVCERLIIALAALLESRAELSTAKAA